MSAGGVHLSSLNPKIGEDDDPEKWNEIHKQVVQRFLSDFFFS